MAESDCIFCKIAAGDIPCHKLYEDELILSFLDIGPLSRGHCLIIPKAHFATLDQMTEAGQDALAAVMKLAPRLGKAVTEVLDSPAWNLLQNNGRIAGQQVDHVHFHIIPRHQGDDLGYRWPAGKLADKDAGQLLEQIGGRLRT